MKKNHIMGIIGDVTAHFMADYRLQLSAAAVLLGSYLLWQRRSKRYHLPPGPRPLPLLGNLLELRKDGRTFKIFQEMGKKYGPVFQVKVGTVDTVVLNTIEAVRDTLIKRQDDYAGRPYMYTVGKFPLFTMGITFGQFSPKWALQRKLAHSSIRKYASGQHLEKLVHFSMDKVTEVLKKQKEPFDPLDTLSLLAYNIICSMCFGKRFELDDPFFKEMVRLNMESTLLFGNGLLPDFMPFLGPVYDLLPSKALTLLGNLIDTFLGFIQKTHEEHLETFDPEHITDLTYHVIQSMKEAEQDEEQRSTLAQLEKGNFMAILSDMFFAGTDTSRFSLQWVVCFAAGIPEVQRKLQEEVDDLLEPNENVSLSHLPKLPYSMAVVYEAMRMRPTAALAMPHRTICDTKAFEYDIPAGYQVFPNLWALHMNPEEWDEPEIFKPERFLDEYGQLTPKPNSFLPFSTGRRTCVGEALAKTELHMLTTMLFQRFTFEPAPGEILDFDMMELGFGCMCKPYKVIVKPRY